MGGEQCEGRATDGQPVRRDGIVQPKRSTERSRLPIRELVQAGQRRPENVAEPREGELGLGLDSARLDDRRARRPLARMREQRRLPDTGLAAHDEGAASSRERLRDDRIHLRFLTRPS